MDVDRRPSAARRAARNSSFLAFKFRRGTAFDLPPIAEIRTSMKLNPWYFIAPVPVALMAAHGAFGAQLAVLGVTLGIFFGTLSLRRPGTGDATTTQH